MTVKVLTMSWLCRMGDTITSRILVGFTRVLDVLLNVARYLWVHEGPTGQHGLEEPSHLIFPSLNGSVVCSGPSIGVRSWLNLVVDADQTLPSEGEYVGTKNVATLG